MRVPRMWYVAASASTSCTFQLVNGQITSIVPINFTWYSEETVLCMNLKGKVLCALVIVCDSIIFGHVRPRIHCQLRHGPRGTTLHLLFVSSFCVFFPTRVFSLTASRTVPYVLSCLVYV